MTDHIKEYLQGHREDMIAMLRDMVNMDSATKNIEGANLLGDYVAGRFEQEGFCVGKAPQQGCGDPVVCRLEGEGDRTLILGHLDTALPQGAAEENPFRIDGDRAYGPGVYDMKAGVVATLFAIKAARSAGARPNLTLVWNCDEETGSKQSRQTIWKEAEGAARCLVMETGGLGGGVTTARKGVGVFTLEFTGVPSHAGADPLKGRSAVQALCSKAVELAKLNDYDRGLTVNVGVISGGTSPAIIPEHASMQVDCRTPDKAGEEHLLKSIREIAQYQHVPGVSCRLEGGFHRPPMERCEESLRLFSRLQRIADDMGIELKEEISGGASDANLTSSAGVPTLCGLGPEGDGAHTREEYLALPTLFSRADLLARLLGELYGQ